MKRTARVWLPSLLALLTLVGLGLALTNTSIGPAYYVINGKKAPWYDGALLAAVSFIALTFSLCAFYFPAWERRHVVLREEVLIGGRCTPALVFPYSTGALAFAACVAVMILTFGGIGNHVFLFFLGLPALVAIMRAVFGRQFVAVTPDGLAWRVMPEDPAQGRKPAGGRDYFTRQPVQFLPWDVITDVALAEFTVTVARRNAQSQVPAKMLRVSVSDPSALDALTLYQRIISTPSGADVLLPLGWVNPRSRYAKFGDGETRGEPEAVWEAIAHYWRCPEERGQIGSPLGTARLAAENQSAPAAPPPLAVIPADAGLDPRAEAQRLGSRVSKQCGPVVNLLLIGLPCLLSLVGMFMGYAVNSPAFMPAAAAYILLAALPVNACVCAAVAAFIAPAGWEAAAARSEFGYTFFMVAFMGTITIGVGAWQYFDPRNYGHSTIPLLPTAIVFVLSGLLLTGAYALGHRIGCAAKTTGPTWLARWLAWCGKGVR